MAHMRVMPVRRVRYTRSHELCKWHQPSKRQGKGESELRVSLVEHDDALLGEAVETAHADVENLKDVLARDA